MKRKSCADWTIITLICGYGVWLAGVAPAEAQYGEFHAETNAPGLVSAFCRPDGGGQALSAVYMYGGAIADATITVTMLDIFGDPIHNFPAEDIWLAGPPGSPLVFCIGGNLADGPTDYNGQTTFTQPVQAGGHLFSNSPPVGLAVVIMGSVIESWGLWQISLNSADIDGDLEVNLTDIALFAQSYFGDYNYRADFIWDGTLNLADVAALTLALGGICP